MSQLPAQTLDLLERAFQLEKWPIARLISLVENETEKGVAQRRQLMHYLAEHHQRKALVLGLTGTPGAGKSSLIAATSKAILEQDAKRCIAVLAIDPSSQSSGGAILGDRTRMSFGQSDKRLFFRSQASDCDLGGLGRKTFHVVRLLKYLFDMVIIETVGIGQSEIEVDRLSDYTSLVMQPLSGDQVQFIKAGIMEVPDAFIVNKCDEEALAKKSFHMLKSSLKLTRTEVAKHGETVDKPIFLTSVINDLGITELAQHWREQLAADSQRLSVHLLDEYFCRKWVKDLYGQFGLQEYQALELAPESAFEERESAFLEHIANRLG